MFQVKVRTCQTECKQNIVICYYKVHIINKRIQIGESKRTKNICQATLVMRK